MQQDLFCSVSPNGGSPNGVSPNGVSPNGVSPNGVSPNGVSPNGVSPNGVSPSPIGVSPSSSPVWFLLLLGEVLQTFLLSAPLISLQLYPVQFSHL